MSLSEKRIRSRIAARKMAEEVVELLEWEDGTGADYAEALIESLRDRLPKRREPEPPKPTPLARLAAEVMEFGRYEGATLEEVPDEYLDWLIRKSEERLKVFREYLHHPDRPAQS